MHRPHPIALPVLILALLLGQLAAKEPAAFKSEFIYEKAPFPSCHASTIVETGDGLVAAWFGGTREGHGDVSIWLSRHVDGKWTTPVDVGDGGRQEKRFPNWNPVLFQTRQGTLYLFFKVGPSPSGWHGYYRTSKDNGKTWSPARDLTRTAERDHIIGPVKNKPVELPDGTLL